MWEMINNAWLGWLEYTEAGKLPALLLAVICYGVFLSGLKGAKGHLLIYGGVMTALCICPVTAAFLMGYQTRFYDYQWIWSMVPMTAVIALGGTLFLTDVRKYGYKVQSIVVTCMSVMVLLLCSGVGREQVDVSRKEKERLEAERVLENVEELCGEDACLWAPAHILEYARREGDRPLLYGRNMWDEGLNAYSYDTYSRELVCLYQWMEKLDDWDITISVEETADYVQKGGACGAECILLPEEMLQWLPQTESEEVLWDVLQSQEGLTVTKLEGYYLVRLG